MQYGSTSNVTKRRAGQIVDTFVRYEESQLVAAETDVLAEFLRLMEYVKKPGRFDPEFKVKNDRLTGKPVRIVKAWSEVS